MSAYACVYGSHSHTFGAWMTCARQMKGKLRPREKETSSGEQIDASVVDFMKPMFLSDFGSVLGGFVLVLIDGHMDGRTYGRTNPL